MKEEILKKLLEYLQDTISFAKSQIPDILQQIFIFAKIQCYIGFSIEFILLISCFFIGKKWLKIFKKGYAVRESNEDNLLFILGTIFIVFIIFAVVGSICDLYTLLKIYYAPKLFLIDYLKN